MEPSVPIPRRKIDRRKLRVALLIASGYVVALVLGVLWVGAEVRGWNEDAMVIGAFAYSFNGTERSLRSLLATKDAAWANESIWWLSIAVDLAYDTHLRNSFRSGEALGLTWLNLECNLFGLRDFLGSTTGPYGDLDNPETVGIVQRFAELYNGLWTDMKTVRPSGTDPLTQLGPDRIQSIRGAIDEITTLSQRWESGPGSLC